MSNVGTEMKMRKMMVLMIDCSTGTRKLTMEPSWKTLFSVSMVLKTVQTWFFRVSHFPCIQHNANNSKGCLGHKFVLLQASHHNLFPNKRFSNRVL